MKNNIKILTLVLVFLVALAGCQSPATNSADASGSEVQENVKPIVITTLFPQYDFVRQITGDTVNVVLIVPPGVEAHSYEPTPQDIVKIQNADLFVYTGEVMEPWASKIINTIGEDNVNVLEVSSSILTGDSDREDDADHEDHEDHEADHDDDEADHDDHNHGSVDPHIWLDPVYAVEMVEQIEHSLIKILPENKDLYTSNAATYIQDLKDLHTSFEDAFKHTKFNTIFSGGHFAFGHFIERYGLEYKSPYNGFAPDAEPTPKKIAQLIDALKDSEINAIFYEELVDPRVAKIVSDESNAEMLMLHAAHNLSKEELESGLTYIEIMQQNLENLKIGLQYKDGE